MSILPIYTYGQPVLRKRARLVRDVDPPFIAFVQSMIETMHGAHGIGLAANQVGSLDRVIVVDISEMEEAQSLPEAHPARRVMVLVNPEVIAQEGVWEMEEGCLSIPEVRADVPRAESITVRFQGFDMTAHELVATGLLGRVIQHEIDHINGVLFIDRIPAARKKLLRNELQRIQKGEFDAAYPVVSAVVGAGHSG